MGSSANSIACYGSGLRVSLFGSLPTRLYTPTQDVFDRASIERRSPAVEARAERGHWKVTSFTELDRQR